MRVKHIKLSKTERVVAVVPEFARGPGWANAVTWVHIYDSATGKARMDAIQPDERTHELDTLFAIAESVHRALIAAVPTRKGDR